MIAGVVYRHMTDIDRFFEKVQKGHKCWKWIAGTRSGYGAFRSKGSQYAHRFSWEIHKGKVPRGLHILHRCDNKLCVSPSHLFSGTQQDNVADRVSKGRTARGERSGRSKISSRDVAEIRRLYGPPRGRGVKVIGFVTSSEIARMFGISRSHACLIVRGKVRANG